METVDKFCRHYRRDNDSHIFLNSIGVFDSYLDQLETKTFDFKSNLLLFGVASYFISAKLDTVDPLHIEDLREL